MPLIAKDLVFSYPGRDVLSGVTLRVADGSITGIVGENGSGKSTLLRILGGELVPHSGTVQRQGTWTFVGQELDAADLTVRDLIDEALGQVTVAGNALQRMIDEFDHESGNLADLNAAIQRYDQLRPWEAQQRIDELLTRFGVTHPTEHPLAAMSVGERYRARLACALARHSDVLLLDEPTNHLDDSGIDLLTAQLRAAPGAVALVTHDRDLLNDTASAILDLDPSIDGKPVLYRDVDYDGYRAKKAHALRLWRRRYHREQQRLAQLAEVLDASYEGLSDEWRPPKGSQKHRRGTRARIHVKTADRHMEQLAEQAVEIPAPPPPLHFPALPAAPHVPGWGSSSAVPSARAEHSVPTSTTLLTLTLDHPLGPWAALARRAGLELAIEPGAKILVTGANGSGKSTLLRALVTGTDGSDYDHAAHSSDEQVPAIGVRRTLTPGVRLGVLVQDGMLREPQSANTTGVDECTAEVYRLLATGALDPDEIVSAYNLGLLSEDEMTRPLAELSTGQRRRFELIRALIPAPHLLIVDEPTNHLSVDLVDDLTAALDATDAAVVIASHDRRLRTDLAHWQQVRLD